ncbi:MAG: sterol desaturase family protein [Alphaproteobacteria bacterium]|nr:sterol desaturase family protein [Alphaproteobacteria bacterium]
MPILAVAVPSSMFYWPYLLSAALLAIAAYVFARRRTAFSFSGMMRAALNKRIWLSRSALADYRFFLINGFCFPLVSAPLAIGGAGLGLAIAAGLESTFGAIDEPVMGPLAIKVAYTLTFFVLYDFGHFLAHYAMHRSRILWEFHKVHHSAEVLNPATRGRLHPVDLWLFASTKNVGGAIATGIFFYIGAGEVGFYSLLGAHVLVAVYQLIGQLRHTHVWISYGRLGYLLISPPQHQIHHSSEPRHWDCNCGYGLAIWDWMFGCLYVPRERETFRMGLNDGDEASWHKVSAMYVKPIIGAAQIIRRWLPGGAATPS